ncbi:MAG: hypothetical protein SFY56_14235 [Bacteroidota bacterium]|nr:hypothetical protein [Bacteroidota bacterium]
MSDEEYKPPFLDYSTLRLSVKEAEKIVDAKLKLFGIVLKSKGKANQIITVNEGQPNQKKYKHHELVSMTRKTGVPFPIQEYFDKTDRVFGGTFGTMSPNWQLDSTIEWAGFKKTLKGPFRSVPSELELAEDIEFYKEETCIESSEYDFGLCYRNYRAFLFSCIALVDAYINRHIVLDKFKGRTSADFVKLENSRITEERIELFLKVYTTTSFDDLRATQEWDGFKKLKDFRNEIVHSTAPYFGISIRDMASHLNYSKKGIGGLLKLFQEWQGRETLSFIERIRTSPTIHFNQITMRADGKHKVKRIEKK